MTRLVLLAAALVACSGKTNGTNAPASDPTAEEPADQPMSEEGPISVVTEAKSFTGTVRHDEIPATKSVAAYENKELILVLDDGNELVLRPTDAIPRDRLLALAGRKVTLTASYDPGSPPDPMSSHPMGPDGPMNQGVGWRVSSIDAE